MRSLKTYLLLVTACVAISSMGIAGPLEDGSDAIERQDYETAFRLLRPLAEQGDVFAQYNLGFMYSNGLGVSLDANQAASWYRLAAIQGDSDAQVNYGRALEAGVGVGLDHDAAMTWYQRSAAQGNAMAQHNIGSMYFNGHGVTKDNRKAFDWYTRSAEQGLALAQNALGAMYINGVSVDEDPNKGLEWILKAANQGLPDAQVNAFQLYYRDAKIGNAGAMHNVGYMCLHGWAGDQDPKECIKYYELAAEYGYAPSAQALSQIYTQGLFNIPVESEEADTWAEKYSELQTPK